MRQDELDRILSSEMEIVPSSGFVASVMDGVRREAATPPAISFPWKRALVGWAASGIALAAALVIGVRAINGEIYVRPAHVNLPFGLVTIVENWNAAGGSWIVLGLVLSFASVKLSMRFGGRKAR